MTPARASAFVERHGIVLESSRRRALPSLADEIAGEPIRGNWWSHPKSQAIFAATRAVRDAPEVLVCRLVDGKVTYVHERLWPALVRLATRFPAERLGRLREVHTGNGAHRVEETAFPRWVPAPVLAAARTLDDVEARTVLGPLLAQIAPP
jgi:hypothetical protein